jgi:pyridoxal phosphate enzyme (YggS family)
MTAELADRYHQVLENIARAAQTAGRDLNQIQLVVVTKGHSPEEIQSIYNLGARHIGENRINEALTKQQILHNSLPGLHWHMIGHLQSRKAKLVDGHFSMLHSLDRLKLADRLEQDLRESGIILPVLLQFNVSGEETKSGWEATSESLWPALLPEIEQVLACSHLNLRGLMTMAPYSTNPEESRPHFARLRKLRDFLSCHFPAHSWEQLSMGMSGDYQVAVQEGATLLRVGTAIMGSLY